MRRFVLTLSLVTLGLCLRVKAGEIKDSSSARRDPSAQVSGISLVGQPVIVFDHLKDKREPFHLPDSPVTAWKNADGRVNLPLPHFAEYPLTRPPLEPLQ